MAVQFDKLRETIKKLGEVAVQRQEEFGNRLDDFLNLMNKIGDQTELIADSILHIVDNGTIEPRDYRGAVPFFDGAAVNEGIDVPEDRPRQATLVSVDGSQAVPSRHDSFVYYLINIGWIVYHLGADGAPQADSEPHLHYPGDGTANSDADFEYARVTIERDMLELETLARTAWAHRTEAAPLIAIMDQRLQYWPIGLNQPAQSARYVQRWLKNMDIVMQCGGLLLGYIERPETSAVVTMLNTVDAVKFGGKADYNKRPDIADVALFRRLLKPGQRSCVYEVVNLAKQYEPFRDANQEICFFYFNPPGHGDVTRVDIPKWAAQQEEIVEQVHGILYDQCVKLGGFPYVITRADELAVVSMDDKAFLERMILREMSKQGMNAKITAKQLGKELTRSGKRRRS